jgi:hypothetical protein
MRLSTATRSTKIQQVQIHIDMSAYLILRINTGNCGKGNLLEKTWAFIAKDAFLYRLGLLDSWSCLLSGSGLGSRRSFSCWFSSWLRGRWCLGGGGLSSSWSLCGGSYNGLCGLGGFRHVGDGKGGTIKLWGIKYGYLLMKGRKKY